MKAVIAAVFLFLPFATLASPCNSEWKETATQEFFYTPVVLPPGDAFTFSDDSQYVMIRIPFLELASGQRYAITFPVDTFESEQLGKIFWNATFNVTGTKGNGCSDIWIEGTELNNHNQKVIERIEQTYSSPFTVSSNYVRTISNYITLSTTLEFQIGQTRGELQIYRKVYLPWPSVPVTKTDFSEIFDWSGFEVSRADALVKLRTLARRVYITPLE